MTIRTSALAAALLVCAASAAQAQRVTTGLVAYYPFSEGTGSLVFDRSPAAPHTDLLFEGNVAWLGSSNGVAFVDGRIGSAEPTTALVDALQDGSEATFEVWIAPANTTQSGPARVLDFSTSPDSGDYDYVLGQVGRDVEARLQHTGKTPGSLQPRLTTSDHFLTTGLIHLVHVFDGTSERLYVDGVQHPTTVASSGSLSNWDDLRLLSIGNAPTGDRSWAGTVRTVAIYDRALSPAEVAQNFSAGADVTLTSATPVRVDAGSDQVTPSAPGMPLLETTLHGVVDDPDAMGPVASTWSQVSGPAAAVFDDASAPVTTVTLPLEGSYVFELTASDEIRTAADRVTVTAPSQVGTASANLHPAAEKLGLPSTPTLELACPTPAPQEGQFLVALDEAFTEIVHDSGASPTDVCAQVVLAGLAGPQLYYWSGRHTDALGVWSAWSAPTSFGVGDPSAFATLSLQDGVEGYAGTSDADIRGSFQNPMVSLNEWNQGAQDILRTGRRPAGEPDEIYRSLLRFELPPLDPDAIATAYLELTGWIHDGSADFFHGATTFTALETAWGEGDGLFGVPPAPGEVSWTYSAYAQPWSLPGAADPGVDRALAPVMRARITNEVGAVSVLSGGGFVELVRQWAADPASNHGLVFQAEDESQQLSLELASREHAEAAFRPRLVVVLPEPAAGPAWASAAVLLWGLARRRRRAEAGEPGARRAPRIPGD